MYSSAVIFRANFTTPLNAEENLSRFASQNSIEMMDVLEGTDHQPVVAHVPCLENSPARSAPPACPHLARRPREPRRTATARPAAAVRSPRSRDGVRAGRHLVAHLQAAVAVRWGAPGTGPASIASRSRTSATEWPSGPNVERSIRFPGMKPGRSPRSSVCARRAEPACGDRDRAAPRRSRSRWREIPAAIAAADPPGGAAGEASRFHGFRVASYRRLSVNPANANSGWLVFAHHDRAGGLETPRASVAGAGGASANT